MENVKKEKQWIFDGNKFWHDSILDGLEEISYEGKTHYAYRNLPNSLYESLIKSEEHWPDKNCIVDDEGKKYTYHQFLQIVDQLAGYLYHFYHVKQGAQVGVLLYNSLEFCASVYAINRLRAVAVPMPTKYRRQEVNSLIEKADLDGIIFHSDFSEWFREKEDKKFKMCMLKDVLCTLSHIPKPPIFLSKPEDAAVLMFTSGTTSSSKGVLIKNYNIMHAIAVYQKVFQITERDKTVIATPAYHATGLVALMGLFLYSGGCIWLHKFFDAQRIMKEVEEQRLTFIHASPTVFSFLLEQKEQYPKIPSIRVMACGSSNMPKQKIKELKEWMPKARFQTVYGLTETTSPATILPEDAAESIYLGSSGVPIPGVQFQICDLTGNSLPPMNTGVILVRGTTVTEGYYHREHSLIEGGWLDTGDLGYFNEKGFLYVVDRKKDMINRGGEKICSLDVENVLYEMAEIKEAAVVGIPDERYGEVPAAMVVIAESKLPTEEKILSVMKTQLATYQLPVKIEFCKKLPMTANLKIDKKKIRELLSKENMEEKQ